MDQRCGVGERAVAWRFAGKLVHIKAQCRQGHDRSGSSRYGLRHVHLPLAHAGNPGRGGAEWSGGLFRSVPAGRRTGSGNDHRPRVLNMVMMNRNHHDLHMYARNSVRGER